MVQAGVQHSVGVFVPQVFLDTFTPKRVHGQFVTGAHEIRAATGQFGIGRIQKPAVGLLIPKQVNHHVVPLLGQPQRCADFDLQSFQVNQ